MKTYQISFFNNLTNSSGHKYHSCQRIIRIKAAKSKERAIEAAKRRFERMEQIDHWRIHAGSFEITETDL